MHDIDRGYHAGFARGFGLFLDKVTRVWFRYELRHADRIPDRPCLLVGNHSGIGIVDVLCSSAPGPRDTTARGAASG